MDLLHCEKYEVKGRVYRRNVPLEGVRNAAAIGVTADFDFPDDESDDFDEDDLIEKFVDNVADEAVDSIPVPVDRPNLSSSSTPVIPASEDDRYGIKYDKKKRAYSSSIFVPPPLMGKLIGAKGSNKANIEEQTGAKLDIPHRSNSKGEVQIVGPTRESVERAYDRVELIVIEGKQSLRFTHFVSLPCTSPDFVARHQAIVEAIRASPDVNEECKEPGIYTPTSKLHLTLALMFLFTDNDIAKAKDILAKTIASFKETHGNRIDFTVKGLSHFGDEDLEAVRVVYGKVHSEKLQILADDLTSAMIDAGFSKKPMGGGSVKLHLTLFKTNKAVDASALLKGFRESEYGSASVSELHICRIGSTDTKTGGYLSIHSQQF